MLMDFFNITALIIIFGLGGWLNWDDLKQAWVRFKERVKTAWNSCERCKHVWVYVVKNPAISFSYMLFVIFTIAFVVLFFWRLYPLIESLYELVRYQIENIRIGSDAFRNVSISIAGAITLLITLLGVLLTLIRNLLTRQQNRTDEERLITEQISRGVDQIGAYKQTANVTVLEPNIDVRLGGLYSLQRIMQDSVRDMLPIARIFYAYVRENVKRVKDEKGMTRGVSLPEDIESALNIINQFNKEWKKLFGVYPKDSQLNLSRIDFTKYTLRGINFSHIALKNANFSHTYLVGADLTGADITAANFARANLSFANLTDANLFLTNLSGAYLYQTDLSGARLFSATLDGVDLSYARNLTQEQISMAKGDKHTKLPEYITRPKNWAEYEERENDGETLTIND